MPKIDAPTVAEHRARQRAALVAAAEELLAESGYRSLGFAALAKRAGLARPSVYWYFKSKDDVALAVCEEVLPRFLARITVAMGAAATPRDQLVAFVRAQLEAAAAGDHRIARALERAPLADATRARIDEIHTEFAPNLIGVLTALGHARPALVADLVQGVVGAAVGRIDAGDPLDPVLESATALLLTGLTPAP